MARRFREPALPLREFWYESPMRRHALQVATLPWGSVPTMTRRSPVVDFHPGYRGYHGYVSPDVFKKPVNVGAIGVGVGSAVGAGALGLLLSAIVHRGVTPGWKGTLPILLPALGAGFLGYLLRWKLDACVETVPTEIVEVAPGIVAEVPMELAPAPGHPEVAAIPQCPEGMVYNPETGRCEGGLI